MLPVFLIRASIDWIRHNNNFKDSNPYSRCEASLKQIRHLWHEEFGPLDTINLEPAILISYWEEFFHAEDPLPDELEWRDGLRKHSSLHKTYEDWEKWFIEQYAAVYQNNNIWKSVIICAWANSHQYTAHYQAGNWRFLPNKPYLPTTSMWALEPHIPVVSKTLHKVFENELEAYTTSGFAIKDESRTIFGSLECLGFDSKSYTLYFPTHSKRDPINLDIGTMVADIVAPVSNESYRQLDHVIFAENFVDITALTHRARYVFASRRRMLELLIDHDWQNAYFQAAAEGWLVEEKSVA
jgi:hypothetical protein